MTYLVYFRDASKVPITGLTLHWDYLIKVSDGLTLGSSPAITEVGQGYYKFTLVPTETLIGRIDGGAALDSLVRYVDLVMSPSDAALDIPGYTGPEVVIEAPPTANQQTLYGYCKELASLTWAEDDIAEMTINPETNTSLAIIKPIVKTSVINDTGLFSFTPDKGITVTVGLRRPTETLYYWKKTVYINDDTTKDILSY